MLMYYYQYNGVFLCRVDYNIHVLVVVKLDVTQI